MLQNVTMQIMIDNKKAAKKLLKRAKAHPDWYTDEDVKYAKMIKKKLKNVKQSELQSKMTMGLILLSGIEMTLSGNG